MRYLLLFLCFSASAADRFVQVGSTHTLTYPTDFWSVNSNSIASAIGADRFVQVGPSGVLAYPLNLWSVNSNAIVSAISGAFGVGSGDVTGPASGVNNGLVLFNGTTGKLVKSSTLVESDILTESEAASIYAPIASPVFTGTVTFDAGVFGTLVISTNLYVADVAYGAGWDGSTNVPTRNAVYDKIQSLASVPILTKTANYTVTSADSASVVDNRGATGATTNTLPTASAGLQIGFTILAAQPLVVKASGSDTIRVAGSVSAAGGQAATNVVGTSLHLYCPVAGQWVADSVVGAWAVQ